ncbi:MAG: RNA polymerase sigma factor [Candidatus Gracilibacteria bacterium]|nr:RNA polymerase sigma factor [Candidatus Gracilibacteria bacterium]MDD3120039.1 RNA polymerase sigma factor [Candidatus Gracilibacteria bacterium]MDD4530387.1 RNA polymerase sigma factor [Candidatus Gracilibacteria bacterium]
MEQIIERAISSCKKGEIESFGVIYDYFIEKIYDFCFYKTFDKSVSEDLTSDVFFKTLKNMKSFPGVTLKDFNSRIYRIAYNTTVDYYRTKKEHVDLEIVKNSSSYNEKFGDNFDNKNKLEEVLDYLDTLPKMHKDILTMRIWDELSYAEISEITNQSVDNCKQIVSRNLRKIQENISFLIILMFLIK